MKTLQKELQELESETKTVQGKINSTSSELTNEELGKAIASMSQEVKSLYWTVLSHFSSSV